MAICNHAKMLSLEVQQLCKTVKARQNKAQIKNQGLIDSMLIVEEEKEKLQDDLYKYSELVKVIDGVILAIE